MMACPGEGGINLSRRYSDIADGILQGLFRDSCGGDEPLLLGAVGGYGRRLLALGSDLDICFVTTAPAEVVAPRVEAMLYPLWDAGIPVGHQLVRPQEVAHDALRDLPMATEWLDFRPLAGDLELMHPVQAALRRSIFSPSRVPDFIERLETQSEERRERFGDTVYLLEPDVKNGAGGLRDFDVALWAARARFGTGDLDRLAALGVLSHRQRQGVERAMDFVWTARNYLHREAGRKQDRLTFTAQEGVAEAMGYGARAEGASPGLERTGVMVEALMSDFYRHARVLDQARARIIGHARRRHGGPDPDARAIGDGMLMCRGGIGVSDLARLSDEPTLALRVYREALARDVGVLARTRDAIAAVAEDAGFCGRLRAEPEAGRLFLRLLCSSRRAPFRKGSVLSELHDVGLLLALVPEFAPVVGRVHHDLYHVFTVDVHSVASVDRLRALTRGDLATTFPLPCRLAAEVERREVLFLATLLHDVGKCIGGRDHAARGAEMARGILPRLGLEDEDIEDVCHLILHHLSMYVVAARRDLSDPRTIDEFAELVRGRQGLRDLYLLTVADLSTTSPEAMNAWKSSMLAELYRATHARLVGPAGSAPARVARSRAQVRALWRDEDSRPALEQFLSSMPERYFLSNAPPEIAAHASLAIAPRDTPVGMSLVPHDDDGLTGFCVVARGGEGAGLCVVAGDRPGLLESISAAISGCGLEIQAAQIHSRHMPDGGPQAVDLFWVKAQVDGESVEARLAGLGEQLSQVVSGGLSPASLLPRASQPSWSVRQTPGIDTEVVFDHHGSAEQTIIEVLTEDRPGLLFQLSHALHALGLSISVAKISTEGRRAVDVFYACEADGRKVEAGPRTTEIRAALIAAVEGPDNAITGAFAAARI